MKRITLFLIFFVFSFICFSQVNLDSLWQVWQDETKEDSIRYRALYHYSWEGVLFSNPDSAVKLSYVLEDFSVEKQMVKYEIYSSLIRAISYSVQRKLDSASKYYKVVLEKSIKHDIKSLITEGYKGMGDVYGDLGEYQKSLENYGKALDIAKSENDTIALASLYNNMANVYDEQDLKKMALEYYFKALVWNEKAEESRSNIARNLMNISSYYWEVNDFKKALFYNEKATSYYLEVNDWDGLSTSYSIQAGIYSSKEQYVEALKMYLKSLDYTFRIGNKNDISYLYCNIVDVYLKINKTNSNYIEVKTFTTKEELILSEKVYKTIRDYSLEELLDIGIGYIKEEENMYTLSNAFLVKGRLKRRQGNMSEAIDNFTKAYDVVNEIEGNKKKLENRMEATNELYLLYKEQGRFKQAVDMFEQYVLFRDSLDDEETKRSLYDQEYKYNYEKKVAIDSIRHEKAQMIKQVEIEKQKVEIRNQKNRQLLLYGGLGIALLFSIYFVRKNREVREQKVEVEKQKDFAEEQQQIAEEQKEILGKQHREIRDSINYAQNLQRSVLPSKEAVYQNFSNSFVLLKPKDGVSGDFFWTYKKGDLVYLAVVDCTGHGVPGAFMTIVANNLLNEIIQDNYNTPKEIVEELHQRIKLRIGGSPTAQVRDSMDLGLFSYNEQRQEVRFVGTHMSIYRVSNSKLEKFKGSKIDIGYKSSIAIDEQVFQVETNDMLYMHSDGYPDQKGGPRGKKFYYQPIRRKFEEISLLNLMEQEQIMSQTFEVWKGDLEQFDDVCMIGVRV